MNNKGGARERMKAHKIELSGRGRGMSLARVQQLPSAGSGRDVAGRRASRGGSTGVSCVPFDGAQDRGFWIVGRFRDCFACRVSALGWL